MPDDSYEKLKTENERLQRELVDMVRDFIELRAAYHDLNNRHTTLTEQLLTQTQAQDKTEGAPCE